jgi:hypothetical protein
MRLVRSSLTQAVQEETDDPQFPDREVGPGTFVDGAPNRHVREIPRHTWLGLLLAAALVLVGGAPRALAASRPAGAVMKIGGTTYLFPAGYYGGAAEASPDRQYYYTDSAGNLAIGTIDGGGHFRIDTFNPSTRRRVGKTRYISLAGWPVWGGFYAGPDARFYVLVGRMNLHENDNLAVVAVRRYDRNWTLLGTAYVQGGADPGGIYLPFQAGAPHMVLVGNRLVVNMGRLIYARGEFVHHQMSFPFEVNVDTMTTTPFYQFGVWNYVSHSFQQLVAMNGSNLIMIDHGDAYPRAITMGVIAGYPAQSRLSTYDLFDFNGKIGDNFTGATVTGLVSGPTGIVVLGNSIRQPDAPNGPLGSGNEHRNIYAISADPATGTQTVRWLTVFPPQGGDDALEPRAVQVGPDRYAVLFSVHHLSGYRMEYRLIDSAATVLASASFPGMVFPANSDPILIGGNVYWVGFPSTGQEFAYLFAINVSNPAKPSLIAGQGPSGGRGAPKLPAPRLAATVSRTGRQVTVVVHTTEGARGTILVTAHKGKLRATIHQRGHHYTFRASTLGRWSIVVRFNGSRGWKSQRIIRTVSVSR